MQTHTKQQQKKQGDGTFPSKTLFIQGGYVWKHSVMGDNNVHYERSPYTLRQTTANTVKSSLFQELLVVYQQHYLKKYLEKSGAQLNVDTLWDRTWLCVCLCVIEVKPIAVCPFVCFLVEPCYRFKSWCSSKDHAGDMRAHSHTHTHIHTYIMHWYLMMFLTYFFSFRWMQSLTHKQSFLPVCQWLH